MFVYLILLYICWAMANQVFLFIAYNFVAFFIHSFLLRSFFFRVYVCNYPFFFSAQLSFSLCVADYKTVRVSHREEKLYQA